MKIRLYIIYCFCLWMSFTSCKQQTELKAENFSIKKSDQDNQEILAEDYEESISYNFIPKNNILKIEHKKMYASCMCLGFDITIEQLKNQIIIIEREKPNEKSPNCKCLINLAYEIKEIEPQIQFIQIKSEWNRNFTFKVDLDKKTYDKAVY